MNQKELQDQLSLLAHGSDERAEVRDKLREINRKARESSYADRVKTDPDEIRRSTERLLLSEAKRMLRVELGMHHGRALDEIASASVRGWTGKVRGVFPNAHFKASDYRAQVVQALVLLGKEFTLGNDAPRGGQCGWYAELKG